jgi:hypothetical protein
VEIFQKCEWLGYFERLRGFDDEVAMEFSQNFQSIRDQEFVTTIRGITIRVNEASISKVSSLPSAFLGTKKKGKKPLMPRRHSSFLMRSLMKKKWHKKETLPHPWQEVAYHIIKYITCEGRMSVVYAYHFILLHQLRHLPNQEPHLNMSIPHFLLQSLKEMS